MLETAEKAIMAARLADDKKAEEVVLLDVDGICMFTDSLVVCTGSSSLQLRAIVSNIREGMADAGAGKPLVDGMAGTTSWVVMDYGDVMIHVMDREAREYYRLESLWGDGRVVEWSPEEVAAGA